MHVDAETLVSRFNDRINAADLDGLARLMTEDHRFVDSAGAEIVGRDRCLKAWDRFFRAFPDYRNHFRVTIARAGTITILGSASCSNPQLDGPAIWTARTSGGRVSEWRVYQDTAENRSTLGIDRDAARGE